MKTCVFVLLFFVSLVSRAEILLGTARNGKGDVVYLERHEIRKDASGFNQFIRVEYTTPEGRVFASMTSDFSKNKTLPETVFEDKRFNLKSILRLSDSSVEFEEIKDGKSVAKTSAPVSELMVAGQGFDNFLRGHLEKITTAPVQFRFGVLGKGAFYSLTGYKRPAKSADEVEFGIKASNWLVRLFADEIRVVYDAGSMRLKSFAGRSNIPDDSGEAQNVTISYQWKEGK